MNDDINLITELNETIFYNYELLENSVYNNLDELYDSDSLIFHNNIVNYVKERYFIMLDVNSEQFAYINEAGDFFERVKLALKDNTNNILTSRFTSYASMIVTLTRGGYAIGQATATGAAFGSAGWTSAFGLAFMQVSSWSFFFGAPAAMLALLAYNLLKPEDVRVISSHDTIFRKFLQKIDSASKQQKDFSKIYKDIRFKKLYKDSQKECRTVVSNEFPKAKYVKLTKDEQKKFTHDRDLTLATCTINATIDFQIKYVYKIFVEKYKTLLVQENEYSAKEIDPLNFDAMLAKPLVNQFRYVEDYKNNWYGTFKRMISSLYKFNNKEAAKIFDRLNKMATQIKSKQGGGGFDFSSIFGNTSMTAPSAKEMASIVANKQ